MCSSNTDDKVKGTYRKNTGKYFTHKKSKFTTCTLFTYILVLLVRCYYGPTGMQCGATMAQLGFGAPVRAIGAQLEKCGTGYVIIVAAHHDYGTMLVVGWQLGQGGQTKKQQSMRRQARFLENMGEAEKTRAPTPASYNDILGTPGCTLLLYFQQENPKTAGSQTWRLPTT